MTYQRQGSGGFSRAQSLEVLSPSNIKTEDVVSLQGYLDGRDDGTENVHQTSLTISPNIYKFWGYSTTGPSKVIWRCNGRSNILNMVSTPSGNGIDNATYNNDLFTYPNIGYASDSSTEYIIDIYPADYESSGTYTMTVGRSFDDAVEVKAPDRYIAYGYIETTEIGKLYPIKFLNTGWHFVHFFSEPVVFNMTYDNLISIERGSASESDEVPRYIECSLDNSISSVFNLIGSNETEHDSATDYKSRDSGDFYDYLRDHYNNGVLIDIKPIKDMSTRIVAAYNVDEKRFYAHNGFTGLNIASWSGDIQDPFSSKINDFSFSIYKDKLFHFSIDPELNEEGTNTIYCGIDFPLGDNSEVPPFFIPFFIDFGSDKIDLQEYLNSNPNISLSKIFNSPDNNDWFDVCGPMFFVNDYVDKDSGKISSRNQNGKRLEGATLYFIDINQDNLPFIRCLMSNLLGI